MASWPSGKARVCKTLIMGSNPIDASDNNGYQIDDFGPSISNPFFINEILLAKSKGFQNPQHRFPARRDYANPIDASID